MGNYNELIKKFDKIRDYMRDFYVYGFKSRNDYTNKSSRTYDNEKRRIESYMGKHMKWAYSKSGKKQFITMNCAQLETNPLYCAWKSKTFTDKDITLHFYILSALKDNKNMTIVELTNTICENSGHIFDIQTVRNKCNEYVREGILINSKVGKTFTYSLSNIYFNNCSDIEQNLIEAIKFFQGNTILGVVGNFISEQNNIKNDMFLFKHYYISHTLEDEILLEILFAMKDGKQIEIINVNELRNHTSKIECVPLKIFISTKTGRRYICVYNLKRKRFFNYRLDHIKSVKILEHYENVNILKDKLDRNKDKLWGVSFGDRGRNEKISIKFYINENHESYIIDRIHREGKNGSLTKIDNNIFVYTTELFDSNDISPWIKTFTGRIIEFSGTNQSVVNRFYDDINKMRGMYNE